LPLAPHRRATLSRPYATRQRPVAYRFLRLAMTSIGSLRLRVACEVEDMHEAFPHILAAICWGPRRSAYLYQLY
jgi:hypothetical protein